jgi:hypothetical protein
VIALHLCLSDLGFAELGYWFDAPCHFPRSRFIEH